MKKFVNLGFAMIIAMAFAFMGCKHSTSEPEPVPQPIVVEGISGSKVFIEGRRVEIIPTLWMCDHEVTQAEYTAIMGANPSYFTGTPAEGETKENRPVDSVSWYDCLVYCNKRSMEESLTPCYTIGGKTNPAEWGEVPTISNETWNTVTCNFEANGYRLPTEAEWEYFARGGNTTNEGQTEYSGSDVIDDVAWYADNSDHKTHEVKKKAPNAKGLYDMSGNVDEWCWDWYETIEADTPSTGPSSGDFRIIRGGYLFNDVDPCRVAFHNYYYPWSRGNGNGFRLVRSAN